MIRNYFADLELHYLADSEEIRSAYRRLARRFHPDLNPEDLYAEESFKRIHEAYRYLSDDTRASRLRRRLKTEMGPVEQSGRWKSSRPMPTSLTQFVTDWTEERTTKTKTNRRENLRADLNLRVTSREIEFGFEKEITFNVDKACGGCRSQNKRSGSISETCKRCAGVGYEAIRRGNFQWKKTCDDCRGQGVLRRSRCALCQGRGKVSVKEMGKLSWQGSRQPVRTIILKQLGHYSWDGKKRGDLWVHLELV